MVNEIKTFFENFSTRDNSYLRDISIALLGAVARLSYDHQQYDGLGGQFWYALFRAFSLALVSLLLVESVVECISVDGPLEIALVAGAGFFAAEILFAAKRAVDVFIEAVIKKIF